MVSLHFDTLFFLLPQTLRYCYEPKGVVSPKLSRILLEKDAVSSPPAWIKKFEPIVTQSPMTIRKYLGKESDSKRCLPIKGVPISSLAGSRTSRIILPHAQIATSTQAQGESEKKKRQAGGNKYRAQKIESTAHARGDSGLVGDALIQTDRQSTF
ncbi:hypothetical protein AVEN_59049-1 [Araneus ventricosus]|uniref:Uncharacterized protein n=1 Tax=Araneus ventricosus TaxID=182803 RepID=A0A4Y2MC79_ARAVE|nr:hypothetical protein AVEN_59049-1 [Araneus ventricosus]